MRILVADDEPSIAMLVASELRLAGYEPTIAEDGHKALGLALELRPKLLLLDVMMPGPNGLAVCQSIRKVSQVPIIMLSARSDEKDKIRALELGADDYMTKPFGIGELLARVNAAIRRSNLSETFGPERFAMGRLAIEYDARRVFVDGEPLKLTATEYKLLCELVRQPGKTVLHDELLAQVWGPQYAGQVEYLWVYVGRLRRKIERNPERPRMLHSVQGVGYRFDPEASAALG